MGIFSNIKINSIRNKIDNSYTKKIEVFSSRIENMPQNQQFAYRTRAFFAYQLKIFAEDMNHLLFNKDSGVFKDDINKINEYNYNQLYLKMAVWFSWKRLPVKINKEYQDCLNDNFSSLEDCLEISSDNIKIYYAGLDDLPPHLINFALYRWCMLDVGHVDVNYESMHENSPDCAKFIKAIDNANTNVDQLVKATLKDILGF